MATLGNTYPDLIDIHAQTPGATLTELLAYSTPVYDDAVAVECNDGSEHKHSIRTGLPTVAFGQLYKGIKQSKGAYQPVKDTTGFLEGRSQVDDRLLRNYNGDPEKTKALLLNETQGFLQSMAQTFETALFYESTDTNSLAFKGFANRFNVIGGGGAGDQVIDAGGTGSDNTSIWFVRWGDRFCHTLYPKGSQIGVVHTPRGIQPVQDADGNTFYAQTDDYTVHAGLAVRDWGGVVRIANIDISAVQAGTVDLYGFMRKAYYRLEHRDPKRGGAMGGQVAVYANRDILEALDGLATNAGANDSFVRLKPMEIQGQEVDTYRKFPVREVRSLLNNEARVLAA